MDAGVLDRPVDCDVVRGLEARGAQLVGVLNAAVAGLVAVLPECRAAFAAGEIGEDHVAAIVNAQVQPRNDAEAAGFARRTGQHADWDCMVWTEPPDRGP
jgi:hypothetical protein